MSIVSVQHRPYVWNPSYTDLVWQCLSDKTAQLDFKYVFDVYINGVYTNRIKQRPNPSGYGLINLGQFVAGYLDPSRGILETPENATRQWGVGGYIGGEVFVLTGEEYRGATGGALTIYNGIGNTAGAPAFRLAARNDGIVIATGNTGTNVRFHAGYKNAYDTYLFEQNPTNTDYPYSLKPATGHTGLYRSHAVTGTNNLRSNTVTSDDRHTLTFWNRTDGTGTQFYVYAAQFSYYGGGTALGNDDVYNTVTNGGGPWSVCSTNFGTTASYQYNIGQIACGPADIDSFIGGLTAGVDRYTVQLFAAPAIGITGLGCELGQPLSEPMEFVIDDCNSSGFGRWRFSWLNDLGGRDWFNFVLRNTETYANKVETYFREPRYNSTGVYDAITVAPSTFGDSTANKTIETNYTATTDWVTEEQSEFLKYLFNSPHVLGYDPDNRGPFLITIKSSSYEVQTYARQKMFNYEIQFSAGQPITTQFI